MSKNYLGKQGARKSKDGKERERGVSMFQEMEETFFNKEIQCVWIVECVVDMKGNRLTRHKGNK